MNITVNRASLTLQEGHCTTPKGFLAAGLHCGARRKRKDLALLWSEQPAASAGMFTTNQVKAAPVHLCQQNIASGWSRAVLVNSGNANACTGAQGHQDARQMVDLMARRLGLPFEQVLLASTGIIGHHLPMEKIRLGISAIPLNLSVSGGLDAAEAIMTTDAFVKTIACRVSYGGRSYLLGGMAKGAGMIHPKLATTLGFVTTDAEVQPEALRQALRQATEASFNCITVDGDTSTNDTVLALANGCSKTQVQSPEELEVFTEALKLVTQELAKMVVKDGEGARRLVELEVRGARSEADAKVVAETIAGSLLFKTMLAGGEPNWGRVLAAAGRSGVPIQEENLNLWFQGIQAVRQGCGIPENLALAGASLQQSEVHLTLDLGSGEASAKVWTCDINEAYVVLNGSYMT